jgi:BirA family biotin operon repressor/biotin-[acetyl-CoA-carboxylase] ligase
MTEHNGFTRTRADTDLARRLRREVSQTEKRLWPHLRSSRTGAPFRRQHRLTGKFTDYCCLPLKLVIEIDGPTHFLKRDAIRDIRMNAEGFDVLRFSVQEMDENLEGVVETIHAEVQLRLARNKALQR